MSYIDKQKLLNSYKQQFSETANFFNTDDELYNYIYKNHDPEQLTGISGAQFRPPEYYLDTNQEQVDKLVFLNKSKNDNKKEVITPNPDTWNLNAAGQLGNMFNWNYLKYAATQGSTDLMRTTITGKSGYVLKNDKGEVISPEEYAKDLNMLQQTGAWLLGQANPVDLGLWFGTAGVGKALWAGGSKLTGVAARSKWGQYLIKNVSDKFAKQGNAYSKYFGEYLKGSGQSIVEGAGTVGSFMVAQGAIQSSVNQRKSKIDPITGDYIGDIDAGEVFYDAASSGFTGTIIGSGAGLTSVAIANSMSKVANKLTSSNSKYAQKVADVIKNNKRLVETGVSIPVEGAILGNAPYLIDGVPRKEDGSVDWPQIRKDYYHGVLTDVGVRTSLNLVGKFNNYIQPMYKAEKFNFTSKVDDFENQQKLIQDTRNSLNDILKPAEVDEFIKNLTEVEKVKAQGSKLTQPELELLEGFNTNYPKIKKVQEKLEKTNYDFDALSGDEQDLIMASHSALPVYSQILTERLSKTSNFTYLKYVADEYNTNLKSKDDPKWKDISREEKDKFIKSGQVQLKSLLKEVDNHINTINNNVINPRSIKKQTIDKLKTDVTNLFKELKGPKKTKAKQVVKDISEIETLKETDLSSLKVKLEDIKAELPIKKQISILKDELLTNMPAVYSRSPQRWQALVRSKKSVESLKQLRDIAMKQKKQEADPTNIEYKSNIQDYGKKDFVLNVPTKGGKTQQKVKGTGKTIDELVNEANVSAVKKAELKLGFDKYVKVSKAENKPSSYVKIVEFFEYLEKNKIEARDLEDPTVFERFSSENKLVGNQKKNYQTALSKFFGGKGVQTSGFIDKYGKRGSKPITTKQDVVRKFGEKDAILITSKGAEKLLNLKYKDNRSVGGKTIEAATELFYKFGRRGQELLRETYAKNIDEKSGTVQLWSGKNKTYDSYPLKQMDPQLFNKLVALKKGKNPDDLLFTTKNNTSISNDKFNLILRDLTSKNKVEINQAGKYANISKTEAYKVFGVSDFRKIIATDSKYFDMRDFAIKLEGRTESVAAGYVQKSFVADYQKFIKERAKLNQTELRKVPEERMTIPKGEPVSPPATAAERERFKKWASKNYPELKTELDKSVLIGDKGEYLPDRVLEQVFGTIVKVRKNAPIVAAFHGNIHPIIKTLRAISKANPNKKLGKSAAGLMRELERRITKTDNFKTWYKKYITEDKMKPAEAKDRAIEEASVLELDEIVAGKSVKKSLYQKIADWLKRAYLNFKSYFTKASKLSDENLTELLGEKIYNRNLKEIPFISFTKETAGRMEFMTAKKGEIDIIRDIARGELSDYASKHKLTSSEDKQNLIKRASIDAGLIDFNIETSSSEDLKKFIDIFKTNKYQAVQGSKSSVKSILFDKFDVLDKIKQYKTKTNLTDKDMSDYFKTKGVKDGDIKNASLQDLKDWKNILYYRMEESSFKQYLDTEFSSLTDTKAKQLKIENTAFNKMKVFFNQNTLGAARFAKSIGLESLSKWHNSHMSAEQTHVGPLTGFIQRSKEVKSFKDVTPVFGLLESRDGDGSFIRLNDKTTLKEDKNKALRFIQKAFYVKEKYNKKKKINEYFNEGIQWNPNTKEGTPEGKLMYFFKNNVMKYMENQFYEITKLRFPAKGAREEFMKDNGIEFLNQTDVGFYIPMRFTKEFGDTYDINFIAKIGQVKEVGRKYAIKRAEKKYGDKFKNADAIKQAEMIDEFIELGIGYAKSKLLTEVEHGSGKTTLKNLISRNEFSYPQNVINKDKSVVRVIENNFDGVVTPFVNGFSKELANFEFAPFAVGLKGYGYNGDLDAMFDDAFRVFEIKNVPRRKEITGIIKQGILERIGVKKGKESSPLAIAENFGREYTSTLMRTQLGGPIPMAGINNLLYQAPNMLLAFRARDVAINFFRAMKFENRLAAQDAGATSSIGLMSWKPKNIALQNATEWIFNSGGQPLTENFNRTWAMLTVMEEFSRLVEDVRTFPSNHKRYNLAENRLKDFYKLTDIGFATLKELGLEPDLTKLSELDAIQVKRTVEGAYNQAKLQGNILTAGTTADSAMPYWSNHGLMKPLLMYKRIAYNTTLNIAEMLKYSRKNKHWMRIFLYVAGAFGAGKLKLELASFLYNQTYPKIENVDWWTSFINTLWYAGFGGGISDIFGPYRQSSLSIAENPITDSALLDNLSKLGALLMTSSQAGAKELDIDAIKKMMGEQKVSLNTAMDDFLKSTFAGYRNGMKIYDNITNPYKTNSKRIKTWAKDWEGKHGKGQWLDIDDPKEDYMYFKDTKKIFESGNDAAFIDHMATLHWANISKHMDNANNLKSSVEKAATNMKNTLARLNPVPYSFVLDDGKVINDITAFLATLDPEEKKVVLETYNIYEKRMEKMAEKITFQLRKKNMDDVITKFDFQLNPKYVKALKKINNLK